MPICVWVVSFCRCSRAGRHRAEGQGRLGTALPVAEQPADLVAERLPLDVAGHRKDRALRPKHLLIMISNHLRGEAADALGSAATVLAQRRRIMPAAKLDQQFLPRLVFQAQKVLQRQGPDGLHLILGNVRPAQDVGVDFQGRGQAAGQGGAPEPHVDAADTFLVVQAEPVEGQGQSPAIAVAGPAGDQVGQDRGDPQVLRRIVDAAGRHQEIKGRRADVLHPLEQQGQAIGEGMVVYVLGHGWFPPPTPRRSRSRIEAIDRQLDLLALAVEGRCKEL